MPPRSGSADLPLHGGRVPAWLARTIFDDRPPSPQRHRQLGFHFDRER